ncbi:MAG: AMP-binding protein [Bacteroidetes bacterium]|nr:AMP-binding protein [Bacteroidota bacterium]
MSWIFDKFNSHPGLPAIICNHKVYTYHDLNNRVEWYLLFLKDHGIQPGNVVGLLSEFTFEATALLLALAKSCNIAVPLDPGNITDLDETIRQAQIDHLVRFREEIPEFLNIAPGSDKHPLIRTLQQEKKAGLILFSSGTTGKPKVMLHDLTRLIDNYQNTRVKSTNSLILLGFDHIGGLDSLFRLLSICATITLPHSRQPADICQLIEDHKVNVLPTTPTFLNLLIISEAYKQYDLSSLEIIGFGAEAISAALLKKIKVIFPAVRLQQKFGTSETNAIRIFNNAGDEQFFRINDPNVQYKIVDNELWLKSSNNILGYLNMETDQFENGWFKTGDLVESRGEYMKVMGRKKEVINVGGEKVLPSIVEEVLLQHPDILDCKVYGMENLLTGQVVAADVVISPATDMDNFKPRIKKYCREKLLAFQVPVKINIVEEITLSSRNKKVRSNL